MPDADEPVLIFAPTGRDALLICGALQRARFPTEVCANLEEFTAHLNSRAAAGLITEEALRGGGASAVLNSMEEQPAWSDVPLILLTGRRGADATIKIFLEKGGNITLLERPVNTQALLSSVSAALRQRKRQWELRDRLADDRRKEERLRQTQKLESLGILAGGIAHDFNNLLTGILGNISLALDCEPPKSPRRKYLTDAIHASERAADLTRQLLAYSGKGRFTIDNVDVSEIVRQISSLIRTSISKNVQVVLSLARSVPCVEADATQIQQIVMNLIINAAEAIDSEKDGLVVVETGQTYADEAYLRTTLGGGNAGPGEYVYVEVRDTGCGIDAETLAKIFDPFFTTKFMGRGLGLAAVLGIVGSHHGALKVESTPGKGSTFRVLFPAADTVADRSMARAKQDELTASGTVLVVDDEEVVRTIARSTLESWGYRLLLAENGQIATDLFARTPDEISLVLLDLTMPVMNGEQTFQRLQRIRPDVRVILMSGYDEADAVERFGGSRLAGFLQKPFTALQLAKVVRRVFERAEAC